METRGKDFMVSMGFCRRVAGDLRVTLDAAEIETGIHGLKAYAVTLKHVAMFVLKVTEALPALRAISEEAEDFYDAKAPDFINHSSVDRMKNPSEEDDLLIVLGTANAIQAEMNDFFQKTCELGAEVLEDKAIDLLMDSFKNVREMLEMLDFISPEAVKFYEDAEAAS